METTNAKATTTPTGLGTAVTTPQPFTTIDKHTLFSVNAGTPVCLVLEQASSLLECTRVLITNRSSIDSNTEATISQFLIDMAKAVVDASCAGIEALEA